MLCENCKKNTANTYFKQTINGQTNEIFLCSECAAKLGFSENIPSFSFEDMLYSMFEKPKTAMPLSKTCTFCGMSESAVIKNGKVGCEKCYDNFKENLAPILNRIHGNKKHIGKIPFSKSSKQGQKTEELKRLLEESIKTQDFEKAAILRDQIKEAENDEK